MSEDLLEEVTAIRRGREIAAQVEDMVCPRQADIFKLFEAFHDQG